MDTIEAYGPDTILTFIGYSDDAKEEAEKIYQLKSEFQDELDRIGRSNDKINRFRMWKWNEDADRSVGGQKNKIDRYIERANIAIFVFKERIGEVTLQELEDCRKSAGKHLLVLFPKTPPIDLDFMDQQVLHNWGEVLNKKTELTKDWTDPNSTSVTPVNTYESLDNLVEIIRKEVNKIIPKILSSVTNSPPPHERPKPSLRVPPAYKDWITDHCGELDFDHLIDSGDKNFLPCFKVPNIFIPLYTNPLDQGTDLEKKENQQPIDIEKLVAEHDCLVIQGQAGSGKTTLIKHLAYSIVNNDNPPELNGYLPVWITLHDFQNHINKNNHPAGAPLAKHALATYFKEKHGHLSLDILESFCQAGKALFLIDGLDEVAARLRKTIITSLSDVSRKNKIVLSGRQHGIDNTIKVKYSGRIVEINDLIQSQQEGFVKKWFKYDAKLTRAGKTPQEMISEMRILEEVSQDFGNLITTPLMLTAVCILYHYDRRLPEQRVELYEKFTNNLLQRRFDDPHKVWDFLMRLAFKIHNSEAEKKGKRTRRFDELFALEIMEEIFLQKEGETKSDYQQRNKQKFKEIEQNCGLLKVERNQYLFLHLSFQEFLTARNIQNRSRGCFSEDIKKYWDNDWYREVVKLFVGNLSYSKNNGAAHVIVEAMLDTAKSISQERQLLGAQALLDIHQANREPKTISIAQNRLGAIAKSNVSPTKKAKAGELLGWLGDPRWESGELKAFVQIKQGTYNLKDVDEFKLDNDVWIGKYPVTNVWYREFIKAGGYHENNHAKYWTKVGREWLIKEKIHHPHYWHDRKFNCPNAPVVGINLYEASAFCKWLTRTRNDGNVYRLPTEQEWIAAVAGQEGRRYPWGDEKNSNHSNTAEARINRPSAVGIFEKGRTRSGVYDLCGNVLELVTECIVYVGHVEGWYVFI